jgi:hypothetical protein
MTRKVSYGSAPTDSEILHEHLRLSGAVAVPALPVVWMELVLRRLGIHRLSRYPSFTRITLFGRPFMRSTQAFGGILTSSMKFGANTLNDTEICGIRS